MASLQELHWGSVVESGVGQRNSTQLTQILPAQQDSYLLDYFTRTIPMYDTVCYVVGDWLQIQRFVDGNASGTG